MNFKTKLDFYYTRLAELYRIQCIHALLDWDHQCYMPPLGAQARANQLEYTSLEYHKKSTDPRFARVVDELYENVDALSEQDQISVRLSKRSLDIERKLPEDYLAEFAQASALGHSAWVKARPANDFKATQPFLEKLVMLARRRAELLEYDGNPYDTLLDLYDPGAKTDVVKPLLMDLGEQISAMLPSIADKFSGKPELYGYMPQDTQSKLSRRVAEAMGFSFESGRMDIAPHPFMTTLGPADFRITTRYDESNFAQALYGVIHETGHALYEMGLPSDYGKNPPLGSPISLSIHESQSRLWENLVGRSREFSIYLSGIMKDFASGESELLAPDAVWNYTNHVEPSLIRVEADEVTYSLHVVVRMLLEEQLVTDKLSVSDLPEAWDDMYEKYLGIRPPDFKDGVMQDMHWYSGSIGYFPTYALGNLYNAMMMESVRQAIADLSSQMERGEFAPLLGWLRENVHIHGMRYTAPDLIRKITGRDLSAEPFVEYLRKKFLS